ncbi:MAG TPA: hypothetical protein VFQ76_10920 [Longimicrobiaceae bacterium]|nr:hypothetical protein [Longimicrobiaceae bacterium]
MSTIVHRERTAESRSGMSRKEELLAAEAEKAFHGQEERAETITGKAERYAVITGVVLGLNVFQLGQIRLSRSVLSTPSDLLGVAALVLLGLALLLALWALQVKDHTWVVPVTDEFSEQFRSSTIHYGGVRQAVTELYLNAYRRNFAANTGRAAYARWAGIALASGFVAAVLSRLVAGG